MDKITEIRIEEIFDEENNQHIIGFIITKMMRWKLLVNLQLNHNVTDKLRGIKNDKFPNQYI